MRLRHKPWAQDKLDAHPQYVPQQAETLRGQWQTRFAKEQPIHIEVGSGKGRFIVEMAKRHPEINYISIEIQTSVIVTVLEHQIREDLPNLQILHADGRNSTSTSRRAKYPWSTSTSAILGLRKNMPSVV